MKPDIGITEHNRLGMAEVLNKLLANEYVLYTKTLNYHWNLEGPDFFAVHKFLQKLYEELFEIIDDVAERIPTLGGKAIASLQEYAKLATLQEEFFGGGKDQLQMLKQLVLDHEHIIKQLRGDIEIAISKYADVGTNNFLTDILEKHEKTAWMLRAHFPNVQQK
jgi:starvation-inducible DNA-binding protein